MKHTRPRRVGGQNWKTFLRNHATEIWACDFLQVKDLFFRPLFAFFIIEQKSRRVIHVNVTRAPTDPWVAQQLREATPFGQAPNISFGITIRNSGIILQEWQRRVVSKSLERRTGRRKQMLSANVFWAV
jgi:hypothetical protein